MFWPVNGPALSKSTRRLSGFWREVKRERGTYRELGGAGNAHFLKTMSLVCHFSNFA